jgi:hypothetical protein
VTGAWGLEVRCGAWWVNDPGRGVESWVSPGSRAALAVKRQQGCEQSMGFRWAWGTTLDGLHRAGGGWGGTVAFSRQQGCPCGKAAAGLRAVHGLSLGLGGPHSMGVIGREVGGVESWLSPGSRAALAVRRQQGCTQSKGCCPSGGELH